MILTTLILSGFIGWIMAGVLREYEERQNYKEILNKIQDLKEEVDYAKA